MRSSGKNNRQSLKNNVLNPSYSRALAQERLGVLDQYTPKCIMAANPDRSRGKESDLQNALIGICQKVLEVL